MKTTYKIIIAAALAFIVSVATVQGAAAQLIYVPTGSNLSSAASGCYTGMTYSNTTGLPCSNTSSNNFGNTSASGCLNLSRDLSFGMRDSYGSSDIARYQTFLISRGYLPVGLNTGYFGSMTLSATRQFQMANGISSTGYVGPITRSRIAALTCNTTPPINNYAPSITSISPSYGPYGTVVTIYGRNFSPTNNSINFANTSNVAINVASSDGVSLRFTIPATPCPQTGNYGCAQVVLQPGNYPISVSTSYGTSNSLTFTLTGENTQNQPPSITGIDGPTNLAVGQSGTWTVRATDRTGGGLSYQVTWGDEAQAYGGAYYTSSNTYTQTATFTHTYTRAGTYTPRFTVRGSNGLTSQTSITVVVGSSTTTGAPTITSLSPSSGPAGTVVTVTGTNFTRYNNSINFAGVSTAITAIQSLDGRTLQFTVPATPCPQVDGYACAQIALGPGTYTVSVSNQNGTSATTNFTMTQDRGVQHITLGINQSGTLSTVGITPKSIVEDSRCPVGVSCIQAGRVVVRTEILSSGYGVVLDLATGTTYTTSDGYRIEITGVTPQRYQNQTIPTNQYQITYYVTR